MDRKVTLNDVAKVAGVAPSSVYKALNDIKGVKPYKREAIVKIAEQLGYTNKHNTAKYANKNIVVLLPKPEDEYRYFYQYIWDGIRAKATELEPLGFRTTEYGFGGKSEDQKRCIEAILKSKENIDGIITLFWNQETFLEVVNDLNKLGIPVFTISSDAPFSNCVTSIMPDAYSTGRLAGEYLGSVIHENGHVIIASTRRNSITHEQLIRGFFDQVRTMNPELEILEIYENTREEEHFNKLLNDYLTCFNDIKGIFASNARSTKMVGSFLRHHPKREELKVLGTEVFKESVQYMRQGVFNALIDQKPYEQGYMCLSIAFDVIVKGAKVNRTIYISDNLYLTNNLPKNI